MMMMIMMMGIWVKGSISNIDVDDEEDDIS